MKKTGCCKTGEGKKREGKKGKKMHLLPIHMLDLSLPSLLILLPFLSTHTCPGKDAPPLQLLEDSAAPAAAPGCGHQRSMAGRRKNLRPDRRRGQRVRERVGSTEEAEATV